MASESTSIVGEAGRLELLHCVPDFPQDSATKPTKPPILFIHGSFCSARDYAKFLPYFPQHGFPAYAVSVRGHGGSETLGWTKRMLLTTLESWGDDAREALAHIALKHPDAPPPVLAGHSLGGGAVQLMISSRLLLPYQISALVLLAASPLSGGGWEISKN